MIKNIHPITKIALGLFVFGMSLNSVLIYGEGINPTKYVSRYLQAQVAPSAGASKNFFHSISGTVRTPGRAYAFEGTHSTINHPNFEAILEAHNTGFPGGPQFREDGSFNGYLKGRRSTEQAFEVAKSNWCDTVGAASMYRGSRYFTDKKTDKETFHSSAPGENVRSTLELCNQSERGKNNYRRRSFQKYLGDYSLQEQREHYNQYTEEQDEKWQNSLEDIAEKQ